MGVDDPDFEARSPDDFASSDEGITKEDRLPKVPENKRSDKPSDPVTETEFVSGKYLAMASQVRPGSTINEDTFLIRKDDEIINLAVIDGMGGHGKGDIAAGCVRDEIANGFVNNLPFKQIHAVASERIVKEAGSDLPGAAYVVATIKDSLLTTHHAGDCRCTVISKDGSLVASTKDEAKLGMLSNCIMGANAGTPTVDIKDLLLQSGDVVILVTDGVPDNIISDEAYMDFFFRVEGDKLKQDINPQLSERAERENKILASLIQNKDADRIVGEIMEISGKNMSVDGGKEDDRTVIVYVHK